MPIVSRLLTEEQVETFWSKVDRTGGPDACWPWLGYRQRSGHGRFYCSRRQWLAHRVAWFVVRGSIPGGLFVCHNCPGGDNPWCVNPSHLWLGTNRENTADRDAKDRTARGDRSAARLHPEAATRGSKAWNAVLTEESVVKLRGLAGLSTVSELARQFGIARKTVRQVLQRKTWTHV